jgi:hypothetical protein
MIGKFLSSQFSGYLAIISMAGLLALGWYVRNGGYQACLKDQIVETNIVTGKRNEIVNNRPDTQQLLDGLLRDANW